ncbi:R8 protein [Saitoella coloradoensis]
MFYNHDLLLKRKGGFGVVWLAATLGSKSSLKKLQKRDILSVDIGRTCDDLVNPSEPMALRLQSNLMVGVTRVFAQQFGFFYADVTVAHAKVRRELVSLSTEVRDIDLPIVGQKRAQESLTLPDDPTFNPDVLLLQPLGGMANTLHGLQGLLIDGHDIGNVSALSLRGTPSVTGSAPGRRLSQNSLLDESSFSNGIGPDFSGLLSGNGGTSVGGHDIDLNNVNALNLALDLNDDMFGVGAGGEDAFIGDLGFEFGADGAVRPTQEAVAASKRSKLGSDSNDSLLEDAVMKEHDEARRKRQRLATAGNGDDWMDAIQEEGFDLGYGPERLESAEPFPMRNSDTAQAEAAVAEDGEAAAAPARKKRKPACIVIDKSTEVSVKEMTRWRETYVVQMNKLNDARVAANNKKAAIEDAKGWVFGWAGQVMNPQLAEFLAHDKSEVTAAVAGGKRKGKKRKRAGEDRGEGELGDEYGRGDDDAPQVIQFDEDADVELGRNASRLPDDDAPGFDRTSLPWNQPFGNDSRAGSLGPNASAGPEGFNISSFTASFIGNRTPSVHGGGGRTSIRGSGIRRSILGDVRESFGPDLTSASMNEDFDVFGGAAEIDTQQAQSQGWLRKTLENETKNFMLYAHGKVLEKAETVGSENGEGVGLTFAELCPPRTHNRMVAADGFVKLLLLATKNIVHVKQDKPYGKIDFEFVQFAEPTDEKTPEPEGERMQSVQEEEEHERSFSHDNLDGIAEEDEEEETEE